MPNDAPEDVGFLRPAELWMRSLLGSGEGAPWSRPSGGACQRRRGGRAAARRWGDNTVSPTRASYHVDCF
jgi:hypothetical protein